MSLRGCPQTVLSKGYDVRHEAGHKAYQSPLSTCSCHDHNVMATAIALCLLLTGPWQYGNTNLSESE